jgi:uncharacterized membrane protein
MLKVIKNIFYHLGYLSILVFYIVFPVIGGFLGEKIFFNGFNEHHPTIGRIIGFILALFLNIVAIYVLLIPSKEGKK